jgi:hypothetical protein
MNEQVGSADRTRSPVVIYFVNSIISILLQRAWFFALLVSAADVVPTYGQPFLQGRTLGELSVSPAGNVWLPLDRDEALTLNTLRGVWQHHVNLVSSVSNVDPAFVQLVKVAFFTDSIGIAAANVYDTIPALISTHDGGRSWKLTEVEATGTLTALCVHGDGRAWLGGERSRVYQSTDHGTTWRTLILPLDFEGNVEQVHMETTLRGVIVVGGEMFVTQDGLVSVLRVRTPRPSSTYARSTADIEPLGRCVLWKDHFVVEQGGRVFIRHIDSANWVIPPFGKHREVIAFDVDVARGSLSAFTIDRSVLQLDSPEEVAWESEGGWRSKPELLASSDGMVVGLGSKGDLTMYMKERARPIHDHVPDGTDVSVSWTDATSSHEWGYHDDGVFVRKHNAEGWTMLGVAPYRIEDAKVVDDTTLSVWAGGMNWRFSIGSKGGTHFIPIDPIIGIIGKEIGTIYTSVKGHRLTSPLSSTITVTSTDSSSAIGSVDQGDLCTQGEITSILECINNRPEQLPRVADFQITDGDIEEFTSVVAKRGASDPLWSVDLIDEFKNYLDSAIRSDIQLAFDFGSPPTLGITLRCTLITKDLSDSIEIWSPMAIARPWFIPMHVKYHDVYFTTCCVNLGKLLHRVAPAEFRNAVLPHNVQILATLYEQWIGRAIK